MATKSFENKAAEGVSYYTPAQIPPAGTAADPQSDGSHPPKLFQPLKLRGVTLQNRIMLSPLCQYSAQDGHLTEWHMAHLGGIISRGPGLAMIEATSVTPEGRITPEDSGLYKDSQMEPLKRIVEFARSQGQLVGLQIGHAGRKGSTVSPWLASAATAGKDVGGWPDEVYAPSAIPYSDALPNPKAMTLQDIENFKSAWVAAVKRAVACGVSVIEQHCAHGYLLHEFLSPASNKRTDQYGGSFENRTRLIKELVVLSRQNMPEDMPLFMRISGTDWLENEPDIPESWTVEESAKLAEVVAPLGVDLIDVSSGGLHPKQKISGGKGYQSGLAKYIKEKVGDKVAVATVGNIDNGKLANELLEDGLDLAICGRWFQKDPFLVWTFAQELGVEVQIPNQIRWAFKGRPGVRKEKM